MNLLVISLPVNMTEAFFQKKLTKSTSGKGGDEGGRGRGIWAFSKFPISESEKGDNSLTHPCAIHKEG